MIRDKKLLAIYAKVALKHGLSVEQVRRINESQYKFARETIRNIDFKEMDESNWKKYKTNFNWKYLGKLFINPFIVIKKNKKNGTT